MLGKTLDFKTALRTWKTKGTFEVPLSIVIWLWTYGSQEVECDGLNENAPSTTWFLLYGLGCVSMLEEVCHWNFILKFRKPMPFLISSFCLLLVDQEVSSQLLPYCLIYPLLLCSPAVMVMDFLSETENHQNCLPSNSCPDCHLLTQQ